MKDTTIAVDIAKTVFEVAVSEEPGRINERRRLSRSKLRGYFAQREPATVLLEACGSAHYWARELQNFGHKVVLLAPHQAVRYRLRRKTDRTDAKALLEAYRNEEIQPVPVKSVTQQCIAALHRLRSEWLATRTARINGVRGIPRELGFIPVGAHHVVPRVHELVEDADSGLPDALRESLYQACLEIRQLERQMRSVEKQLKALAQQIPVVEQLRTIPGVGLLTATAMVAFVGDIHRFRSARRFASYLGLTPRERSSGNVRRLGRISKQGDVYLRMLLTHGARSVLCHAKKTEHPDRLRSWALSVEQRRGHNKTTIAIANKLARIIWAVWTRGGTFQSHPQAHAA